MQRASSGEPTQETGTVRLTTGAQLGIEVMPKMLAEFSRRHPRIELELSISTRPEDLLHRSADIAVRVTRPTQKALIVRRLGSATVGLFAHRNYVEAYGVPRSVADLARHHVIGFDREMHILRAFGGLAAGVGRKNFAFRTDNVTAQLALLRAGAGIAACHADVAKGYAGMIPILPREVAFQRQIWLVMHADLKKTRRVRLLFDHLQRELTRHLATQ
jgi:DNA-binding transcriptional LysR family regulator